MTTSCPFATASASPLGPAIWKTWFGQSSKATLDFSRELYKSLVEQCLPVDEALQHARVALGQTCEWLTPVLYLSTGNADVFGWSRV